MSEANIQQGLDAIDALHKIASLLNAALYLTRSNESDTMTELVGIAEEVAKRVIASGEEAATK